jgi:hypothetical protein
VDIAFSVLDSSGRSIDNLEYKVCRQFQHQGRVIAATEFILKLPKIYLSLFGDEK